MLAYLDSSILLRKIFGEPNPLAELSKITYGISSILLQVECLRTADRYRIANQQSEGDFLMRVDLIYDSVRRLELIHLTPEVLSRASQPFPKTLKTLDAIHLSTCLAYKERMENQREELFFCSHDEGLKRAAKSVGLQVLG